MKRNELAGVLEALFWALILVNGVVLLLLWATGEL